MKVWVVTVASGEYSDWYEYIDSVWTNDADALTHVVHDMGMELKEFHPGSMLFVEPEPKESDYTEGKYIHGEWYSAKALYEDAYGEWSCENVSVTIRAYEVKGTPQDA